MKKIQLWALYVTLATMHFIIQWAVAEVFGWKIINLMVFNSVFMCWAIYRTLNS